MSKNNGQWRRSTATGQQRRANGNRSTATVNGNGMAMRDWQQRHDKFFEKKKNNQKKSAELESFWKKSSPHRSISKKKISWIWHQKKIASLSHLHTPVPMFHACIPMLPFPRSRPKVLIFTLKKLALTEMGKINGQWWRSMVTSERRQVNGDGQWWRYGNGQLAAATR